MHMSDALLSPAVGSIFWAGSLGIITYCARKLKDHLNGSLVPLMGVIGAFIFAAQMINFTIPGTGSSGHLGGGMILAILLGHYAALITMASVLTVQCLFFADGGLLALGCNIWNLGVYPCFIVYPLIYRPLVRSGSSPKRIATASVLSALIGLQLGSFSVVLETLLSGRSELPFNTFILLMQPVHLAIGLVEGFVTAGVINFVKAARPEILESVLSARPLSADISIRKLLIILLVAAILTGGALSWFSSSNPDGLEWSIEKVFGKPELPEQENMIASALKAVQEKLMFLPDYDFPSNKIDNSSASDKDSSFVDPGTSVSGLVGSFMVLGIIFIFGFGIKVFKKSRG